MICPNCGKEIVDRAKFCPFCGKGTVIDTGCMPPADTENGLVDVDVGTAHSVQEETADGNDSCSDQEIKPSKIKGIMKILYSVFCIILLGGLAYGFIKGKVEEKQHSEAFNRMIQEYNDDLQQKYGQYYAVNLVDAGSNIPKFKVSVKPGDKVVTCGNMYALMDDEFYITDMEHNDSMTPPVAVCRWSDFETSNLGNFKEGDWVFVYGIYKEATDGTSCMVLTDCELYAKQIAKPYAMYGDGSTSDTNRPNQESVPEIDPKAEQGDSIASTIKFSDFVGDFNDANASGDLMYVEGLLIDQSGSKLNVLCAGYRVSYFEAEVDASALHGNTLYFQGYDTFTDSTYDVALTYVPAGESPYQADTIYMKADGLFDTAYVRYEDENNTYPDGYTDRPTDPLGNVSDGDQQFYEEHGYYPFEDPNFYSKDYVPDDMKEYYESFDIVSLTEILEDEVAFYNNYPLESPIAIFGIVTVVDLAQSYVSVRDINNTGYAMCYYDDYDSSGASQFEVGDPVKIYGYINDISTAFTTDKIASLSACEFFEDYVV